MATKNVFQCKKCESYMENPLYCLVHGKICPSCGASEEHLIQVPEMPHKKNMDEMPPQEEIIE